MKRTVRSPARLPAAALAAALASMLAAGCGVKDAPRPIEDTAALAAGDFVARNTTAGVLLKWQRPKEAVDGTPLYDLAGFDIQRRPADVGRFETIDRVLTADTDRLRPQSTFRFTDETAGSGVFEYRIRAFLADGQRGLTTDTALVDTTAPVAEPD